MIGVMSELCGVGVGGVVEELDGGEGTVVGGVALVGEGVRNALVSSIAATKSPSPRFVAAHDPYVFPANTILPAASAYSEYM